MKKVLFIALSLVLLAAICGGCTSETEPETPATEPETPNTGQETPATEPETPELVTLRFAHFGIPHFRDIFVAQELGFFEANGVEVELVQLDSTSIVPALIGGSVDGGAVGPMDTLPAIAAGADMKLIASGYRSVGPEDVPYICVLKDSPITTIEDLDGKTISGHGSVGSQAWLWVEDFQKENDIEFSQYFGAPSGEFQPMMTSGQVDCSTLYANDRLITMKDDIKIIAPLTAAAKFGAPSSLWFSTEFLEENPEAVQGFIDAIQQAREYEEDHQLECFEMACEYSMYGMAVVGPLLEHDAMYGFPDEIQIEVWQYTLAQDLMLELGIMEEAVDIEAMVDTRFAEPVWEMPEGYLDFLS
ncbi:MAG: ABC transporter substrate-binding protein [Dehalococcoidia bacterium]|jgi:ABC-type nitrate/sulfonate/bicarbonate transport system substrate-binding protein